MLLLLFVCLLDDIPNDSVLGGNVTVADSGHGDDDEIKSVVKLADVGWDARHVVGIVEGLDEKG